MPENTFHPLTYIFNNTTLRVEYSDITALSSDVLVSSDDTDLSMGGGVSSALLYTGGEQIWRETRQWAPVELGSVAITTAGLLKAKRIFHAAVLDYDRPHLTTIDLIRSVTKRCLVLCDQLGFKSIAFPALATGAARLSPERSAVAMLLEIATHLNQPTTIHVITIALYTRSQFLKDILPNFYAQVSKFLEMTQRLNSITAALDNLERVYHTLSLDKDAASVAFAREDIRQHQVGWEQEILQREPEDTSQGDAWQGYSREIESDLQKVTSLRKQKEDLDEILAERGKIETWKQMASEYKEYRSAALEAMITIRGKNITDLELEQATQGFSVAINRQLEHERQEIIRLETELQELKVSIQQVEVNAEALQKSTKKRLDDYYRGKGAVIMRVKASLAGQEFEIYKNAKGYQRSNPRGKQIVKSARVRKYEEGNGIYAVVFDDIEPDEYIIEWRNLSWGVTVEAEEVRVVLFD